jgi:hypothetical protein
MRFDSSKPRPGISGPFSRRNMYRIHAQDSFNPDLDLPTGENAYSAHDVTKYLAGGNWTWYVLNINRIARELNRISYGQSYEEQGYRFLKV